MPYVILKTNASQKAWGAFCQEIPTGVECTTEKKEMLIIILELKVEKLALMSFHKQMKMKVVHFQIDNTTALMYLLKMGGGGWGAGRGSGKKRLLDLTKVIWDHILKNRITLTADKLPKHGGRLAVKEPQG